MKTGAMRKLSASVMVLVLALSATLTFQLAGVEAAGETNDISLLVLDATNGATVETATVNLVNLYTGEVVQTLFSSDMYVAVGPPAGVYRVEVTDENYYDAEDAVTEGLKFDALSQYTGDPVNLFPLPVRQHTWNVTVKSSAGQVLAGATVGFYDESRREAVVQGVTNAEGYALLDMYEVSSLSGIYLFAKSSNYETYVQEVTVTGDDTLEVALSAAKIVRGLVRDMDGRLATETVAYLVNQDDTVPWVKRVLKSDLGGASYVLYGYEGTFTLCVDAYGLRSEIRDVTITPSTTYLFIDLNLEDQTQRTETVTIDYGADFNSFDLAVETTWSYDDTLPGLPYGDVGSLRMQIDLNSDTTDGTVDSTEAGLFNARLADYGPEYVSTAGLLLVNDTAYEKSGSFSFTLGSVEGDVGLTGGVSFEYGSAYVSHESIDVGAPDYYAAAHVKYDKPSVDYIYTIAMPAWYEMTQNSTGNQGSRVNASGFTTVTLDPQEYVGGPEVVDIVIEKSVGPEAGAGVVESEYVFAVTNETGNITHYMVSVGEEVNFTAVDSRDPNGNPLEFTWDFGDGSSPQSTFNVTIPYTYVNASSDRTVNLTVTDVAGIQNWTEITVVCDGRAPSPVITVKDLEVNETSGMLEIDQGQLVWFNASGSSDDAVSAGDEKGLIEYFEFFYGEGNTSGRVYMTEDERNVSHSWRDAGEYPLALNMTDAVGHWTNVTMTVKVNDTEAPTPTFTVKNATWGTDLVEKLTLVFDANATTDNLDNTTTMHFSWFFNDDKGADSWLNGTGLSNVTHVYDLAGSYAVRVNVTDTEGNWNGYTKTVVVVSGPRPRMIIDSVTFDPATFTEGESGHILVNMTNRGSAPAKDIVLKFYIKNDDGTEKLLGTWSTILNGTTGAETTTVAVGGTATVKFPYKFSDQGTYRVNINVTSTDQLAVDENVGEITVDEAGWKRVALWAGVIAVIVLIPLLLYMRGRWSKRERKGPRREKQEKSKKDKDETA